MPPKISARRGPSVLLFALGALLATSDGAEAALPAGPGTPASPPPASEASAPATTPDPGALMAQVEETLLGAPSVFVDFHITAEGMITVDLRGQLRLMHDGSVGLDAQGDWMGQGVDLFLDSHDGIDLFGVRAAPAEQPTPDHLKEALVIGMTRMGLLHNLARLTGNAPPDHGEGGVRDWVVLSEFHGASAAPGTLGFDITVAGQPSGSGALDLSPEGLPVERRQTVQFPQGEMKVVERYTRVRAGSVGPVIREGRAQPVEAFSDPASWIREELWVETEFDIDADGAPDRMHVAVVRPAQTDDPSAPLRVPVIYGSSPYYNGVGSLDRQYFWDVRQELGDPSPPRTPMPEIERQVLPGISNALVDRWVPRGFAVVHSSAPGTGYSQGCPTIGGEPEALAPKAVIDWLNGRARGFDAPRGGREVTAEWSTGKVGMTGTSYNGTIPVAAATTGVEGLEVIIPDSPNNSYYRYYRSHGLVRSPGGYLGEDADVLYDFIHSGDPEMRAYCNATFRDGEMARGMDRATGDYNEFWAGRDVLNRLDGIEAAVLGSHGLSDWNVMPEHTVRVHEALVERGVTSAIYFHQGGHGGPPPLPMQNLWFSRFLLGVPNGAGQGPRLFVQREGADRNDPTPYPDFPNPEARPVQLTPVDGGNRQGALMVIRDGGSTLEGIFETLVDDVSYTGGALAEAMESPHRLLYAAPPLVAPAHISGTPRLRIRLASSKPAANLSVWLVSLPGDAPADSAAAAPQIITRGWADPRNHRSLTESEPLVPGEFYGMEFTLQPDDQVIPAGRRIALMIFSSDREYTLWPEPGTELTVDLGETVLTLPVVGGLDGLQLSP